MTCPSTKLIAQALGVSERQAKQLLDKSCPLLQVVPLTPELQAPAQALCTCQATDLARELLEKAAKLLQSLIAQQETPKRKRRTTKKRKPSRQTPQRAKSSKSKQKATRKASTKSRGKSGSTGKKRR